MELLDPQLFSLIEKIFGAAAASDFMRTLAIFCAAAWVHSRGVRKEIRKQVQELIAAFKEDHERNKKDIGGLRSDVDKINKHLRGEENGFT